MWSQDDLMTRFSSTRLQGVCSVMPKTTRLSQNGNGFQQTWISHNHVSTYYIYIYVHSYLFLYIYIYIYSPHPKNFASPSRSRPWPAAASARAALGARRWRPGAAWRRRRHWQKRRGTGAAGDPWPMEKERGRVSSIINRDGPYRSCS